MPSSKRHSDCLHRVIEPLEKRLLFAAGDLLDDFGTGGRVLADAGADEAATQMLIQANGRILVGGTSNGNFAIARFTADGGLDTAWGGDGTVVTDFGGIDILQGLAQQPDGRILAVGTSGGEAVVARYLPDGTLDTTFDSDGLLTLDDLVSGGGIVAAPDNTILVAGTTATGEHGLVRLTVTGAIDEDYGTDGLATSTFGTPVTANDVLLQPDGRAVVVGGGGPGVTLSRFTPSGTQDPTFGTGGEASAPGGVGRAIVRQPDGRYLVVGDNGADALIMRFNAGGATDITFGTGGRIIRDFAGADRAQDVVLQGSRILVVGTQNFGTAASRLFLMRLTGGGAPDAAFGDNGVAVTGGNATESGVGVAITGSTIYVGGDFGMTGDLAAWAFDGSIASGGGGGGGGTDTLPPTARLVAQDMDTPQGFLYTFDVIYDDNTAILRSTIGDNDIIVRGPNGFEQEAQLVNVSHFGNAAPITATYQIIAPGGAWDPADQGVYTVILNGAPRGVSDVRGNYAAGASLGTFRVGGGIVGEIFRGTPGNDVIDIRQSGGSFIIVRNGQTTVLPFSSRLNVFGFEGNDIITVDDSVTADVHIDGGAGNDTITGGRGNDVLTGGEGHDRLIGRGGDDRYVFTDALSFQIDTVVEREGEGVDTLDFSALNTRVWADLTQPIIPISHYLRHVAPGFRGAFAFFENVLGGMQNDTLIGNDADNTLDGGPGNDVLIGGRGSDHLIGGFGDDRYVFTETTDVERDIITENAGQGTADILDFTQMATGVLVDMPRNVAWHPGRHIPGIQFIEIAWGGSGNDYMIAGNQAVRFTGGAGDDVLIGSAFDDQLSGGTGNDLLLGLGGRDTFVFFRRNILAEEDRFDWTPEDIVI